MARMSVQTTWLLQAFPFLPTWWHNRWEYQHELLISPHEMREHHLQLNWSKTQLIVCPASPSIPLQMPVQFDSTTCTYDFRNLGVMVDDQLTFKVHFASFAQSSQFSLYNIRRIRPYLTEYVVQLFKQYHMFSTVVHSGHFTRWLLQLPTRMPVCMLS